MRSVLPLLFASVLAGCAVDTEAPTTDQPVDLDEPGVDTQSPFFLPPPGSITGGLVATFNFPTVPQLGIAEEREGWVGWTRTRVPIPTSAECLAAPGPAALRAGGPLGIQFRVESGITGAELRSVRLVRLGPGPEITIYNRTIPAGSRSFSESFVPLAGEAEVAANVTTLPRLRYELVVEDTAGRVTRSRIERKLAPMPSVSIVSPARVTGPNTGRGNRVLSAGFRVRNAEFIDLVGVRSSPASSSIEFGVIETEATVAEYGPPATSLRITPSPVERTGQMCDGQFLSSPAWNEWKAAGLPMRVYARAPLIEGCQLWELSESLAATDATTAPPVPGGPVPSWPVCSNHGQGVSGAGTIVVGGTSGGSTPAPTCTEGAPCEVTPAECDAKVNPISVAGKTRCTTSGSRCVPTAAYCPTTGSANCGAAYGNACRRDDDCAPGLFCGMRIGGCVGFGDDIACGSCQHITYRDGSKCTPPPGLCWLPGTLRPGQGCYQNDCTPQCDGSTCGNDGCGGLCGTCKSGEYCEPKSASPYGGTCKAM
jgi:hypothetical protein